MPQWDTDLQPFDDEAASIIRDRRPPRAHPVEGRGSSSQFKSPFKRQGSFSQLKAPFKRRGSSSQFKGPYPLPEEPEDLSPLPEEPEDAYPLPEEVAEEPLIEYPIQRQRRRTRRPYPPSSRHRQPEARQSARPPSSRNTRGANRHRRSRWQRLLATWRKKPRLFTALLLLLLIIGGLGTGTLVSVISVEASLTSAQDHLSQAQKLVSQLSQSPLNQTLLESLRAQVAGAESDFVQAQSQAAILSPAQSVPGLSQKATDAFTLIQMGVDLTSGGREVLDALLPLVDGLHGVIAVHPTAGPSATPASTPTPTPTTTATPVSTPAPAPALTVQEFAKAQAAVNDALARVNDALNLRKQIQDGGASLGGAAVKALASFDHLTPTLNQAFSDASLLLRAAPVILGIQQPVSYLIEILDASELRAGGGFIGNYGVLTLSGGRIGKVSVTDTYLLDDPYLYGENIDRPFPASFGWFPLASRMGLRDSDLSPDFVFDAQTAEQIYTQESGGQQVAGVVAFSPTLIADLLKVTGPVYVGQPYNVTVNSDNLVTLIHYYQFQTTDVGVPSGDGVSSTRKHFTAVLGETFFGRLRTLSAAQQEQALQVGFKALKTKDLQVYLNNADGEALLQKTHLSNGLAQPQTDAFEVVDNNVGGNKATAYVQEAVTDSVVVAPDGSSSHSLTVAYSYKPQGDVYGRIAFRNIVQVYVPLGSQLTGSSGFTDGLQTFTTSTREFWSGYIIIQPNDSYTVTFTWKAPAPPDHAQGYELIVGRQADSVYSFSINIQLPTSATHVQSFPPLTYANGRATYQTRGQQTTDLDLKLTW